MGEITVDLRLVIKIPRSKLTINGPVLGLKQGAPEIHAATEEAAGGHRGESGVAVS